MLFRGSQELVDHAHRQVAAEVVGGGATGSREDAGHRLRRGDHIVDQARDFCLVTTSGAVLVLNCGTSNSDGESMVDAAQYSGLAPTFE